MGYAVARRSRGAEVGVGAGISYSWIPEISLLSAR